MKPRRKSKKLYVPKWAHKAFGDACERCAELGVDLMELDLARTTQFLNGELVLLVRDTSEGPVPMTVSPKLTLKQILEQQ